VAEFDYRAVTDEGELVLGKISALDEAAAHRELEAAGLFSIEVLPSIDSDEDSLLSDIAPTELTPPVETAADSQLPIEVTLAMLSEETDNPRLARVARKLAVKIEQGTPLLEAVSQFQGVLPPEIDALLRAGIDTGDIGRAIGQFSQQQLETQQLRRRIRAVLAYPLIVIAILVPIALFLSIFVIPMFKNLFEEFDLSLPPMTEVIVQASEQLPGFLIGALLFVFGLPLVLRVVGGRWLFHRVRSAVPLLGPIWTSAGQREFASSLASFVKLRVPLISAVTYTGDTIGDRNVGRACHRLTKRLETGASLSESMRQ
jgi:type II secretory pathway component PulF